MYYNDSQHTFAFFSVQFMKWNSSCIFHTCIFYPATSGPMFSSPAFSYCEIWLLVFQSYRSAFDLFGASLVLHFLVMYFLSTWWW